MQVGATGRSPLRYIDARISKPGVVHVINCGFMPHPVLRYFLYTLNYKAKKAVHGRTRKVTDK